MSNAYFESMIYIWVVEYEIKTELCMSVFSPSVRNERMQAQQARNKTFY